MQPVLALEFDAAHFNDTKACLDWLAQSDYEYLLNMKNFRLRPRNKCIWLSGEARKVFAFSNNVWKYPNLFLSRPDPYVAILKRAGTETFQPVDIPVPLPKTIEREQKNAERKIARQEAEQLRNEKRKAERKAKREAKEEVKRLAKEEGKTNKRKATNASEGEGENWKSKKKTKKGKSQGSTEVFMDFPQPSPMQRQESGLTDLGEFTLE